MNQRTIVISIFRWLASRTFNGTRPGDCIIMKEMAITFFSYLSKQITLHSCKLPRFTISKFFD
nr:hypothetical protein Iba_chr10aCG0640 [Ipomoea batatas]